MSRTFWILWTAQLINRLGGFIFTFLPLYLTEARGMLPDAAGRIVSLYALGAVVGSQLGGRLSDVIGRRPVLLGGMAAATGLVFALGFAREVGAVAGLTFLFGVAGDLYRPAIMATISDSVAPEQRKKAYSYLYWAVNLGFAVAAASAGWLAQYDYFWLFAGDAATTAIAFCIVALAVPETKPEKTDRSGSLWIAWADGRFALFILIQMLVIIAFMQVSCTLPLDMRMKGIGPASYGSLIAINGVLIVILQPFVVKWTDRWNNGVQLTVAAVLVAVGVGAQAFATQPLHFAVTIAVWTLGEILFAAAVSTVIAQLAPAEHRGSYQGAYTTVWAAGAFLAPLLGPTMLVKLGPVALWMGAASFAVVAAAGHATYTRRLTADPLL